MTKFLRCTAKQVKLLQKYSGRELKEIRVGGSYLELVESIEAQVVDEGAALAFPLNLSLNEDAAHDTASRDDHRVFLRGDVAKLDLGVQIDGYIADTATTVDLGNNSLLLQASEQALEAAIGKIRPGGPAGRSRGCDTVRDRIPGNLPISNLTGHGLDQYVLHKSPTIHNIGVNGGVILEEGMVFAIEPFATTGSGHVSEKNRVEIFSQISEKPVRIPAARAILEKIRDRKGLPFARRWLGERKLDIALPALVRSHILHDYPLLADIPGSLVSQHEHTVIVTEDGCIVTTR